MCALCCYTSSRLNNSEVSLNLDTSSYDIVINPRFYFRLGIWKIHKNLKQIYFEIKFFLYKF